jgi:exodeoxyribonuclease III
MRVGTWNVNGIRARSIQVLDWVARERPDIVCLQEIKARPDQLAPLLFEPEDYWCRWHGAGGYSGVALMVKHGVVDSPPVFESPSFDVENRMLTTAVAGTTVASIYVPNGGKDYEAKLRFLDALIEWVKQAHDAGRMLLLCGDFNVAHTDRDLHPRERKAGGIGQRPEERVRIDALLAAGLVDIGRALSPESDSMFTWWAPWRNLRQRNIGWRIDLVLASQSLAARAVSCPVLAHVGTSDHAPVQATFADSAAQ